MGEFKVCQEVVKQNINIAKVYNLEIETGIVSIYLEEKVEEAGWVGKPLKRYEDRRLITGKGQFTDDLRLKDMVYAAILRSPFAHAYIKKIDVSKAEKIPGVIKVVTGKDIAAITNPFPQVAPPPADKIKDYCMAVDKVRYMGEPVAVVVAEDMYTAYDALEQIDVEYQPLPAVVDGEKALEPGAPVVHEELGSNVVWHGVYSYGDIEKALSKADVVIEETLRFNRYSAIPLENNVVIADYNAQDDILTIYAPNQMPMVVGFMISVALGKPLSRIRMISKDIGGGFGTKINNYVYMTLLGVLSMLVRRPVKWVETRRENLSASSSHCNERTFHVKAGFTRDGVLLGLKVRAIDDIGAYPRYEPLGAVIWAQVSCNVYRFKDLYVDFYSVATNKCPTGPVRGYSRLQHMWMIERIMDIAAKKLGISPVEIRMRNYIRREEMPYTTPSGCVYDGGDYQLATTKALELINYDKWRKIKEQQSDGRKRIGIGIGVTLDSGSNNFGQVRIINPNFPMSGGSEAAWVKIDNMGNIIAAVSSSPQGQGHETVVRQLVADELGVTPDMVTVLIGFDSFSNPFSGHSGTYASRFAALGATAVVKAAQALRGKVLQIAAALLATDMKNLTIKNGEVTTISGDKKIPIWQIANVAWSNLRLLPKGIEPGLFAHAVYAPDFTYPDPEEKRGNLTLTYSYQVHAAVVEVDTETGAVKILDYAIVDDCGREINPLIVRGQVIGSAFNAIAAALYENFEYSEDGQLLNSSLADYLAPTAADVPMIEKVASLSIPSLSSPLGTRGVGEGGGSPLAAIAAAVEDAIGVKIVSSHIKPSTLWNLIKNQS
ncbi:MAG: xanthine dehydrogenase family protein molybdopterin-binding subunit [Candidatus Caldarchaeum sp.]